MKGIPAAQSGVSRPIKIKKVKLSLTMPRKHTGKEATLHSFLNPTPVRGGQLHAPADLSKGKEPWHQLNRKLVPPYYF
jgi:hypothetical protein